MSKCQHSYTFDLPARDVQWCPACGAFREIQRTAVPGTWEPASDWTKPHGREDARTQRINRPSEFRTFYRDKSS